MYKTKPVERVLAGLDPALHVHAADFAGIVLDCLFCIYNTQ